MRTHSARAPFHSLRAAMIAAATVTLAAWAHVLAGGQLPAPGILFGIAALTGLASTAATRLRLGLASRRWAPSWAPGSSSFTGPSQRSADRSPDRRASPHRTT